MKRCLPKMWRSHTSLGKSRHHWQRQHHLPKANIIEKRQVENRLGFFLGRGGRTRTRDPRFWRPVLYQLSYTPLHSYIISHTFCFCKSFFDFFLSFFLLIITFTAFLLLFALFYAIILLINLFSEAFYEA